MSSAEVKTGPYCVVTENNHTLLQSQEIRNSRGRKFVKLNWGVIEQSLP